MSTLITNVRPAGPDHQVLTVEGGSNKGRRTPCPDCPWRKDAVGVFPASAFIHSASTGYDVPELLMSGNKPSTFGCHQSGSKKPQTCAGFLLSECADHSLALRLQPEPPGAVEANGLELFPDYYEMAVANGVPSDHPAIKPCVRASKGRFS